jgi:hypothetical protein
VSGEGPRENPNFTALSTVIVASAGFLLHEPLDEVEGGVGDLAPAAVDGQGVSAVGDLDDLGDRRVVLLPLVVAIAPGTDSSSVSAGALAFSGQISAVSRNPSSRWAGCRTRKLQRSYCPVVSTREWSEGVVTGDPCTKL